MLDKICRVAAIATCVIGVGEPSLGQTADTVAAGAKVYDTHCAHCHGERLENPGITYDLRRLRETERTRFEKAVLDGKNLMPPWRGVLKEEEVESIWVYVRANANP